MAGSGTGTQSTATTVSTTAEKTIKRAMRLAGILASGETPDSDMYNDALTVWQQMYDSWSAVSSIPPVASEATHTLVVGTSDYTIGLTGDVVRVRPTDILNVTLRRDSTDHPVGRMRRDEYYAISTKSTSARPSRFFFEQKDEDVRIRFDAQPDYAYTMYLYTLDPLTAPTAIDDDTSMQPGYEECVVYNLALRLMPEYGISLQARPEIAMQAAKLLKDIKNRYAKVPEMVSIFRGGRYDIYSDRGY